MKHKNILEDVPYRANLRLQIALEINVYVSAAWAFFYGFHILYNLSRLTDFNGMFVIIGYILALGTEYFRLYEGYSGNLNAQVGDLSTFLVMTPLIQLPLMLFLLLTIYNESLFLHVLIVAIFALMVAEVLFGLFTWRKFAYHQSELFQLRKEVKNE